MNQPPTRLRVNHHSSHPDQRILVDRRPRISWWLPGGSSRQFAYRFRYKTHTPSQNQPATALIGPWINSPNNVLVPWPGSLPKPGNRVEFQVQVRTDLGESPWSAPTSWELNHPSRNWNARWIEPDESDKTAAAPQVGRPAQLLRTSFRLAARNDQQIFQAHLRATAHGLVELYCNGTRLGEAELLPGFTAYRQRLQVHTFDLTPLLRDGENVLGAILSDGWFRGRHGFLRTANGFGNATALLAEVVIWDPTGRRTTAATDQTWQTRPAWFSADLMDGQREDRNIALALTGWAEPRYQADQYWRPARVVTGGLYDNFERDNFQRDNPKQGGSEQGGSERLVLTPAPPVRRIRQIPPVELVRLPSGAQIIDFGENLNGWISLGELGPAGTDIKLTHGETLAPDGSVSTDHLRAVNLATGAPLPAGQVDTVRSAGVLGDRFEPRHTTHGFRYVQIDGLPPALTPEQVHAVVVHTDLAEIGSFSCADPRLNQLHDIAIRSFLSNACDLPTDCPQRERSGFTGDWQIFQPSALFTHDVAGFTTKWIRDLICDQWADGTIPNITPDPAGPDPQDNSPLNATNGSAGWGDAIVLVPWQIWQATGDQTLLAEAYPAMCRWVNRAANMAAQHRHPGRAAKRPQPAAHEQWLWDTGFHFGEWLEPGVEAGLDPTADQGITATAYLHSSAKLLASIAGVLDRGGSHRNDRHQYQRLAAATRQAWQAEYLNPDGTLTEPSQGNYVRALDFGLIPPDLISSTAAHLVSTIRAAGNRLGTGFLSTGRLLPVLADHGYPDLAHQLLIRTGVPSWLEMVARGATTVWEAWDGVDEWGTAKLSLNHYSKGAVIHFLHGYVAGLRVATETDPSNAGWKRFLVAPVPGPDLAWASAEHLTPYGPAKVRWVRNTRQNDHGDVYQELDLEVTVPPGSTAQLVAPDGSRTKLPPGNHRQRLPLPPAPAVCQRVSG